MPINSIIEKIIREKISCFFISPHLDDAVFSAGGMLSHLARKTKVTLVTVFTEASGPPYTLSAKVFLKKNGGYQNALDLFKKRRLEDTAACKALKADMIHLGLVDASFRKKKREFSKANFFYDLLPELNHVYPIYRLHVVSGKISGDDKATLVAIEKKLQAIKKSSARSVIFCPYGIGGHVDHIIVRDICKKVFPDLIFWNDFPYNRKTEKKKEIGAKFNLGILDISDVVDKKIGVISLYESQKKSIFLPIIEFPPEAYHASRGEIKNL